MEPRSRELQARAIPSPVGTITAAGTDVVHITGADATNVTFKINNGASQTQNWPVSVVNSSAGEDSPGMLQVVFDNDITSPNSNCYFSCGSPYIQFGSRTLRSDGTRPKITMSGGPRGGLIQNGAYTVIGHPHITICNLIVDGSSATLYAYEGWIGADSFGNGATYIRILNCSSVGDIPTYGGGILGYRVDTSAYIECCDSSGTIGYSAGGISGPRSSDTCVGCLSRGPFSGDGDKGEGGGILGSESQGSVTRCVSLGASVGISGGGITGYNSTTTINSCYSACTSLATYAGAIAGAEFTGTIRNCITKLSTLDSSGYGILESNYSYGSTWSDTAAKAALEDISKWVRVEAGQPWWPVGISPSIYSREPIASDGTVITSLSINLTKDQGWSTGSPVLSGYTYTVYPSPPVGITSLDGLYSSATVARPFAIIAKKTGSTEYRVTNVAFSGTLSDDEAIIKTVTPSGTTGTIEVSGVTAGNWYAVDIVPYLTHGDDNEPQRAAYVRWTA